MTVLAHGQPLQAATIESRRDSIATPDSPRKTTAKTYKYIDK